MNENLKPISELPPFLKFCYTIGMLPTSYRISMTYEEQVLEAIRFIKEEIIPIVNSNALATKELQEKFVELVNYVETYLDDLNVQEEINNKLDKMADDGTLAEIINQEIFGELNTKINENISNIENLNKKVYGNVPNVHYIYRNGQYGDAIAIELENNNILIDLGIVEGLDNLIAYLITNNITKFKYMMISHWDIDHSSSTEGFKRVIENAGLDFSECTFILPPQCNWSRMTGVEGQEQRCLEITNYLIANNYTIKYPTEEEIITLDENNFMKFYNYNPQFISQYETIMLDDADMPISYTQINNISGVMELNSFGKTFLFTGDIYRQAEENIASEIPKINVLKIPHHGLNRYNSPTFTKKLLPEIGVIMNGTTTLPLRPYTRFYCDNDAQLFTTNESGNIIVSIDEYGNIIPKSSNGAYNPISNNVIRSGYDLNDYIIEGKYFSNNLDENNPVLNLPPNYNNMFVLNVETITNAVIYQKLITLNVAPYIWFRKTTNGGTSWTEWKQIALNNFSYIMEGLTTDYNISSSAFEKLPIDKTIHSNNLFNCFSVSNNEIVIGKGVSQIEVSCTVNMGGLTAGDRIMVAIYKNNGAYTRIDKNVANEYEGVNLSGQIIDVNENDKISLYVRNLNSRGRIYGNDFSTNLTVKTLQ